MFDMKLTAEQSRQMAKQVRAHRHAAYSTDIEIGAGLVLRDFHVSSNVLRPEMMSALQLAQWLLFNNGLYTGKAVLDLGCGTGIQGIVMGLCGARKIVFADIAPEAVANTQRNIARYRLEGKSNVFSSDLFEAIRGTFDVIVFNHPFFSDGTMQEQISVPVKKISRGRLIHRFLVEAKKFLRPKGVIVMPYYLIAGPANHPGIQAKKHGYMVTEAFSMNVTTGIQRGPVSIFVLQTA